MDRSKIKATERKALLIMVLLIPAAGVLWYVTQPKFQEVIPDPAQSHYAESVGLPLQWTNSVGMVFRLIPPGTYQRGSPPDEYGREIDERQHDVTIPYPFYMAVTETTQSQYEQVTGTNTSFVKGRPNVPVDSMTFAEALEFCNALSRKEGREEVYSMGRDGWVAQIDRNGYRLPLEAEWEYACRAGTTNAFGTGPIQPLSKGHYNLWRVAWYEENSKGRPRDVGGREPNVWGLYDMLGNVWEYCWDWYGEYPMTEEFSLLGPNRSNHGRVVRGGCWYDKIVSCRAATRKAQNPSFPLNVLGFRCAITVNLEGAAAEPSSEPVGAESM